LFILNTLTEAPLPITGLVGKYGHGGSQLLFHLESYFYSTLNSVQNFITLGQPLLGEKYVVEREEMKNNNKYSGHFVPQQGLRAAHALRSDQFQFTRLSRAGRIMVEDNQQRNNQKQNPEN
jgi:hypothetical protein